MLSQIQQRAREITARDFAEIAASSSSIPKQHFPQLLERHLLRQATSSEVAIMTTLFGESGLQLDSWVQWLDGSMDCQNHTGCQDKIPSACVEQRSETGLTEGIDQTQASCEKKPSLSQDGQTPAEEQTDAAPAEDDATPSVEEEVESDQQLAANEISTPVVEWVADLPEGAFAEFESRAFIIPKGEHRATKLSQLRSLATLVQQVLKIRRFIDENKYSDTHGEVITWPMVNMYVRRSCSHCAHDFALCSLCLRFCLVSGTTYVTLL